jgi:predicted dehydrogenase
VKAPPRLGFVGVGWIGRARMQAIVEAGAGRAVAVADVVPAVAAAAAAEVGAEVLDVEALLLHPDLEGVVIATPSALHAEQACAALGAGRAVFCQKPLARDAREAAAVVDAAARADRLLGVDLSYRHLAATRCVVDVVRSGGIGDVYSAELVFHNAYGPDKPWFLDPAASGGGCVIDLGTHLVDLAALVLGGLDIAQVTSHLFAGGRPAEPGTVAEDHARVCIETASGQVVELACSWFLHAGRDAVIGATFHGTTGAAEIANVDGSFYDFTAAVHRGTTSERLVEPPDAWGGRAAIEWARQLGGGAGFDPAVCSVVDATRVVDRIYGRP